MPSYQPKAYIQLEHPDWAQNAVLYQINVRQYSLAGTFAAVENDLARLENLGADILWLMPIHPIGETNRKGSLGSPYAVKDYFGVNPEFGTLDDLKSLVVAAHDRGMRVILDWVANHTAWDNPLVEAHPEWYQRDWKGDFRPTPWFDWTDIIDLDYANSGLREFMVEALRYWVEVADIDGYRCDVAGFVPLDFWEQTRAELEAIKPVFMLAEYEGRDAHARAFDATYAWEFSKVMQSVARGDVSLGALLEYFSQNQGTWPQDAYRMTYTSNHDYNAWIGTDEELYGEALEAMIALTFVVEGMPMIYNGQEAGLGKRLEFFEKDVIAWRDHSRARLFKTLIDLKHDTQALWNGSAGGRMIQVVNSAPDQILSFVRASNTDRVFAVFNLSADTRAVRFSDKLHLDAWIDAFSGRPETFRDETELRLAPWAFRIFKTSSRPV